MALGYSGRMAGLDGEAGTVAYEDDGGPDDSYCEGDAEHLARVDLTRLGELAEAMAAVDENDRDSVLAFYDELHSAG